MRFKTSLLSVLAPPVPSKAGGDAPQSKQHSTPPRYRLFGGDSPHGGVPPATGHAGRKSFPTALFPMSAQDCARVLTISLLLTIVCGLIPNAAFASIKINFPNGGSADLNENGTISGTAWVGEWDDPIGTHFPITMPDGTKTFGWCQDRGHYAPSPGNHPFVATPTGNGSYNVTITTSDSPPNPRQVEGYDFVNPPQRVGGFTWSPVLMGKLTINKSSSLAGITDFNGIYSLANARYGVFSDSECVNGVGEFTTDADGNSNELELEPGTYWIKELNAPEGYRLDENAYEVEVRSGQTTTESVLECPQYEKPDVWATKQDIEYQSPQGSASFANAEFAVRYYDGKYDLDSLPQEATRTWVLKSNEAGQIIPCYESLVWGSAFYFDEMGQVVLPLGTLTIQETKAPSGYWLEGQDANSPADYVAPVHLISLSGQGDYGVPIAQELVRRAGISLHKVDAQTDTRPQGDSSLENIEFSIVSRNDNPVVVDGVAYQYGDTVGTILTDSKGNAQTPSDYLPLGTYEVMETATNESMLPTAESQTVTLDAAHSNKVIPLSKPMKNRVVCGGVKVGKVSRETGQHLSQGETSLKGALFTVTLDSSQPVEVNGAKYNKGEVVCTLSTDSDGFAATDDHALPYGTYTVKEEEPPEGFLPNADWSQTVRIREDGVVVDLSDEDHSADDQVMRGSFSFNKADDSTMERMGGIPWLVTSTTTGEKHVMVSDENGIVDTEAVPHGTATNANDRALVDGAIKTDALDPHAGIWFSGRADLQTDPDNSQRALPYDVYTVDELRCEANKNSELVTFTVRIHKHDAHLNMGTIDNKRVETPSIGTTLAYAGNDHVAPAGETVTLVDTMAYSGLKVGQEYVVQGELHHKDTGNVVLDANDDPVVSSTTFVPNASAGSTQISFELDSSNLEGSSVVAFEYLFFKDERVAEHTDLGDEGQTIYFPSVRTSLADGEGNQEVRADQRVRLVDVVSYSNLVPNMRYEVEGTLVNKESGEALTDETGQEIHASASFVPSESNGEVEVEFSFAGSLAEGKTLVAFEVLRRAGIDLASHQNIDDIEQTVHFPAIHTSLTNEDGQHVVTPTKDVELTDTISYEGLEPGTTYTITGTLVDKATGEPINAANDHTVTASTTFVPQEPSGIATVVFVVDASAIPSTEVVAFESLLRDEREVAIHANLSDEAQTVRFPSIHTTLVGVQGTHEIEQDNAVLTDTVSYQGLCPFETYTIEGTIMDKDSGEPLEDKSGKPCSATSTFTPEVSSGTTQVTFELDASTLGGHSLVAFEALHEGESVEGREIARHDDINDEGQTVVVPRIGTTASNAEDSSKTINEKGVVRITDTVEFEGLTPGETYEMEGTLYDKTTGKEILDAKDKAITSSVAFCPESSNGSVVVEFEFDAERVAGDGVVVYETCLRGGRIVATHHDLDDENQTLTVERSKEEQAKKEQDKKTEKDGATSSVNSRSQTPVTGDRAVLCSMALVLAALGTAALVAHRILKRRAGTK